MAKTLKPLPKALSIGGITYQIKLVDTPKTEDGQLLFGRIKAAQPLIEIDAELDVAMQWQVLWHELVHAILNNLGHRNHDEQFTDAVGAADQQPVAAQRRQARPHGVTHMARGITFIPVPPEGFPEPKSKRWSTWA